MGTIDIRDESHLQHKLIHIHGVLDLALSEDFRDRIMAAIEPATVIVVDLSDVTGIDSVGLSAIVAAGRAVKLCPDAHLRVVVPPTGPIRRMFELTLMHLTVDVRTSL